MFVVLQFLCLVQTAYSSPDYNSLHEQLSMREKSHKLLHKKHDASKVVVEAGKVFRVSLNDFTFKDRGEEIATVRYFQIVSLEWSCSTVNANSKWPKPRGGDTQLIHIPGVSPRKFHATQKYQFSFIATQKYQFSVIATQKYQFSFISTQKYQFDCLL